MPEQARAREQATLIVFQQELPVQLVNVSRSGCLLQAARPVRVGTVGRLRISIDDVEYADDVRIARCDATRGTACQLGVELLWVAKTKEPPQNGAPSLAVRLYVPGDEPMVAQPQQKET
jgi:PilZ domain